MATDNRTIDERLVSDILFGDQSRFGQFRGGGDQVGSALANFINARNDARARALRNEEFNKWQNGGGKTQPTNPNVAIGADANGVYGANQQSAPNNRYSFASAFQGAMQDGNNGYKPFQIQAWNNAVYGEEPEAYGYRNPNGQPEMNIRDQVMGQNYNQRIDSQYGNSPMGGATGMNIPTTPYKPANSFAQGLQNAENPQQNTQQFISGNQARQFNDYRTNALKNTLNTQNPSSPAVDGQTVQTTDGAQSVPQSRYNELINRLASSKYLGNDYQYDNWMQRAQDNGITGDATRNVMYRQRIKPLIDEAREDRLRESFRIANDENLDQRTRLDAVADLAYSLRKPDIAHEILYNREKEARERYKWELEKERLDWLRENGFMPSGGGGGGRSPGRPRVYRDDDSSGGSSPRRPRRPKKAGFDFDTPTFDGILTSMYRVPNGGSSLLLGSNRNTVPTTNGTGISAEERLKRRIGVPGIYANPHDPENYMDEPDNYIVYNVDEKPQPKSIAEWAKSEDATKPLATGKFPLFDTERGVVQGFYDKAMKENKESKEKYAREQEEKKRKQDYFDATR